MRGDICGMLRKRSHFFVGEEPPAALAERAVKKDRANGYAFKRLDVIADSGKHATNLMVQAFANRNDYSITINFDFAS